MFHVFNLIRFLVFLSVCVCWRSCDGSGSWLQLRLYKVRDQSDATWVLSAWVWRQMLHYGSCRTGDVHLHCLWLIYTSVCLLPETNSDLSYREPEFKGTVHPNKESQLFSPPLLQDWTSNQRDSSQFTENKCRQKVFWLVELWSVLLFVCKFNQQQIQRHNDQRTSGQLTVLALSVSFH